MARDMYRSDERHAWRHSNGRETSSYDFNEHVSSFERPSSASADVSHYPDVHALFNNKVTWKEETESHHKNHHSHKHPQFQERVEVVELKEERLEGGKDEKFEVFSEEVDVKADGFLHQKHKGFELCKWESFQAH